MIVGRAIILVFMVLVSETLAQSSRTEVEHPEQELTNAQRDLADGSRNAIIQTGISAPYFAKNFRLVKVVDTPSDRRVVWEFSVNEYRVTITDPIGYYTEGVKRIDIHGVETVLKSTTDIIRTIPRTRALRILRSCLGKFSDTAIEYRADDSGRAGLFLTAASIPKSKRLSQKDIRERERKRKEEASRAKAMNPAQKNETDVVDKEDGDSNRPPIFLASVNLQTGKCTRGIAQAGPPTVR